MPRPSPSTSSMASSDSTHTGDSQMIRWSIGVAMAAALGGRTAYPGEDAGTWFDKHEGEFLDLYDTSTATPSFPTRRWPRPAGSPMS